MDKEKIKQLRKQGLSYGAIGKMFGVTKQRIYQICGQNKKIIEKIKKCPVCGGTHARIVMATQKKIICDDCKSISKVDKKI